MILKKVMEGGNNQLSVVLPKDWSIKNNIQKGKYVSISVPDEPTIEILEEIKNFNQMVTLHLNNNIKQKGRVLKFVEDGVLLDSGYWVKFEEIRRISKRIKGGK